MAVPDNGDAGGNFGSSFSIGPASIIPAPAAKTARVVAMAVVALRIAPDLRPAFRGKYSRELLDSFQLESRISLESLEKSVFPFASRRSLKYRCARF
jgi:hypothetical protein